MTSARCTDTAKIARTLRLLAQDAERVEDKCDLASDDRTKNGVDEFFTCVKVSDALGSEVCTKYAEIFACDCEDLWGDARGCMGRRVLSLCFMAAMVETGDV